MAQVYFNDDEYIVVTEPPADISLRYVKRASARSVFVSDAKTQARILRWVCESISEWHMHDGDGEWLDGKPIVTVETSEAGDIILLETNLEMLGYERQKWLWGVLIQATFEVPLDSRKPSPNGSILQTTV